MLSASIKSVCPIESRKGFDPIELVRERIDPRVALLDAGGPIGVYPNIEPGTELSGEVDGEDTGE